MMILRLKEAFLLIIQLDSFKKNKINFKGFSIIESLTRTIVSLIPRNLSNNKNSFKNNRKKLKE
jgi:hypothetical protein